MIGKGKRNKVNIEMLKKIESSLGDDYENKKFQIDLINTEITSKTEIVNILNDNSSRLQHLLNEEPKLIRWWFDNFKTAIKPIIRLSQEEEISYRFICLEKKTLFIQVGNI